MQFKILGFSGAKKSVMWHFFRSWDEGQGKESD